MATFAKVPLGPVDPVFGISMRHDADTDPRKVNLGVGAYRTEEGSPLILNVVREAEEEMFAELGGEENKEYQPIDGPLPLKALTQKLIFGEDSSAIAERRIASAQSLSGTGALRLTAEFAKTFMPSVSEVWVSDPTWGNHHTIFQKAGLPVKTYPYWNAQTMSLNFEGMMNTLEHKAAEGAMIVLHACAHNPTGVDPTQEQWEKIAEVMQRRKLVPVMDSAYQGYATGDLDRDAWAMRLFARMGFEFFVCQSFAKNLGLYGERIGMMHVVTQDEAVATAVLSQIKMVIRPMYSSPPVHSAQLVIRVLGDEARYARWCEELGSMSNRILEVRQRLREGLEAKEGVAPGAWKHVTDQIGMFSFTGLTPEQCEYLTNKHHIYLLPSGRISLAGLNNNNVQYMIDCTHDAVTKIPASSSKVPVSKTGSCLPCWRIF